MSTTPPPAAWTATSAEPPPSRSGPSPRGGRRRVDASMSLLREVMEHPLDPGYQMAADRRARGERRGRVSVLTMAVIAVMCGWMVTRGVAELRRPEPGQAAGRAALEREITRRTAVADATARRIQQLRAELAAAQQQMLTQDGDADLAARAERLALVTGELPVSGPGLEITLRDASAATAAATQDPRAVPSADLGRVIDRDLQVVVNGLLVAGAEALAINGQRLTTLSAIRSAGQAILVDFRPLVPPYRVQAVGDPSALQSGFASDMAGSYVQSLRDNYGVQVAITAAQRLTLPGAGAFALRQARADPSLPGSASAGGSASGQSSSRRSPSARGPAVPAGSGPSDPSGSGSPPGSSPVDSSPAPLSSEVNP